jgi:hypothetical protein
MMNMEYELAHERSRISDAPYAREATRLASAARWRRIEHLIATAHERVARLARVADERTRISG